jgi:DNA-binding MarR family transcriptional regulator
MLEPSARTVEIMSDVEAVRAVARLSRVLERACPDLSLPHYRVLAAVADGDERASRVAARLALGKPTVSASVEALCRRGLLTREDVAHDQRAVTLRLTPAGETALREAEEAMTSRLAAILERTPRGADVTAALVRLATGLDRLADERIAAR